MVRTSGSKKKKTEKSSRKGKVTKIIHESTKEIKLERALIDNFIGLQKVMVNLSTKFDSLSMQISKLLELFEISAKSLARKDFENLGKENSDMKKVVEKLDNLTQQAGLIGKGLALIHEVHSDKESPSPFRTQTQQRPPQLSNQEQPRPFPSLKKIEVPSDEYQKSIGSENQEKGI